VKLIIGLVGQVCAGKSAVAAAFEKLGAKIYDADKYVHELYRQPEVIEQVRTLFGDGVVTPAGEVDRNALGRIVFADAGQLKRLTQEVVFPRTSQMIDQEIEAFRKSDAQAMVLDAPTLFESGRDGVCDRIIFVSAPLERRREWAKKRGWDENELLRRDKRLQDEQDKRRRVDAVIENAGTIEDLNRRVEEVYQVWRNA
jgi:dephospho-CoA kinase